MGNRKIGGKCSVLLGIIFELHQKKRKIHNFVLRKMIWMLQRLGVKYMSYGEWEGGTVVQPPQNSEFITSYTCLQSMGR